MHSYPELSNHNFYVRPRMEIIASVVITCTAVLGTIVIAYLLAGWIVLLRASFSTFKQNILS